MTALILLAAVVLAAFTAYGLYALDKAMEGYL